MAGKKAFSINTPRGSITMVTNADGSVTAELKWAPGFSERKEGAFSNAQEFVDSECLRYMNPDQVRNAWNGDRIRINRVYHSVCTSPVL